MVLKNQQNNEWERKQDYYKFRNGNLSGIVIGCDKYQLCLCGEDVWQKQEEKMINYGYILKRYKYFFKSLNLLYI